MATVRKGVELELVEKIPSVKALATRRKAFHPPERLRTGRPKKMLGPGLHLGLAGGVQPLVSTLPPSCPVSTSRNFCSKPKPQTVFSPTKDIG